MHTDNANEELIFYNLAWDREKENFEKLLLTPGVESFIHDHKLDEALLLKSMHVAVREELEGDNVRFLLMRYQVIADMETGTLFSIQYRPNARDAVKDQARTNKGKNGKH